MKLLSAISCVVLLVFSCNPNEGTSSSGQLEILAFPPHIQQKMETINYLDSAKFAKVDASIHAVSKEAFEKTIAKEDKLLIEKLCKKSKGYQNGIWEGQNDCSWAVEMNNLERFATWAKREGDSLILKLKNGESFILAHSNANPEQELFFQFKNYLQNEGFFVVEVIQNEKCKVSKLINDRDGTDYKINGSLYFSNDHKSFLSAAFDNEMPWNCTNKIEFYKIANAQIEKLWHIPTGNWGVTQANIVNQREFLIEQSTTGIAAEYKRYAKVSSIE